MSLLLLIAAAIGIWAYKSGRYRALGWGGIVAIVAGLLAIRLLVRGEVIPALVGLGWAGGWLWYARSRLFGPLVSPSRRFAAAMSVEEARGLLDVPPAADAAAIRAAHRRLIARVHPDTGGSPELARRVNGARDTLLADLAGGGLNRGDPRAS